MMMNSSLLLTPNGKRRGRKPGLNSTVAQRSAANARERSRMRVLSGAFVELKGALPWVPKDTKLSKLDTLKLAAGYIAYLRRILDTSSDFEDKPADQHLEPYQYQQSDQQDHEPLACQNSIPETLELFSLVAHKYEPPVHPDDNLLTNYKQNNPIFENPLTMAQPNRNDLDSNLNSASDLESLSFTNDTETIRTIRQTNIEQFDDLRQFNHVTRSVGATVSQDSISTDSVPSVTYLDLVYGEPTITDSSRRISRFNLDGNYETGNRIFSPNKDQISNLDHFVTGERNRIDPELGRLFTPSMKSIWTSKFRYDDTNLLDSGIYSDYTCKIRVANSLNETVLSLCEASKQMETESMSIDPFLIKSCHSSTPSSLFQSTMCFP